MYPATSSAPAVVSLDHVSLNLGDRALLQDASVALRKGEFVYLVGRTGAGKSSLLRLIYADLTPGSGTMTVGGQDITRISRAQKPFLRRKLGIVFQDYQLLPEKTVFQNIRFALRATGWRDRTKIQQRIQSLLMQVGLSGKLNAWPHQLSGGEQQRVTIARAMINEPLVLLADEPTGNLDPEATRQIMELLIQINRAGTAILLATHDYHLIRTWPARVLEIHEGQLREYFSGEQFIDSLARTWRI
ncbi:MAG: ATP-binding cassette domain-containing protein [Bacteroidia bacterium]|nr:ATP-binding cassette domain-containing protein [Bacteroidia bacterium]